MHIVADGKEYDILNNTYDGITVTNNNDLEYIVTITESFFVNVSGGHRDITFHVEDVDGGKLNKSVVYNVQGVMPITTSDYDLWFGNVTFRANVLNDAATAVKIAYRANGGEWTEVDATAGADGVWTATGNDFAAEKNYDATTLPLMLSSQDTAITSSAVKQEGSSTPTIAARRSSSSFAHSLILFANAWSASG